MVTVVMAADHAGFEMKEALKTDVEALGHRVLDVGTDSADSVDYPDFGWRLAAAIRDGRAERGILVCGTGIGISMAANREPKVRAAAVSDATSARLTRLHNDANVLALGARVIGIETARDCVRIFFETEFEGGRHQRRVDKLGLAAQGDEDR
ncbi:ribose 5-phosphate isomerase B [Minwuia thermotolerans]|uniref:Ribose 5-phosphate isomerase B n=1 Tax=Minwuia thermotolerans TaxID=2056226 RepID=A0A2M9FYZ6_9PROT|nr:ribose 5-phosphate isomerase B [Minwuia thermotolerans]PJK28685.1 ribose 5-phosphate isomerase B [Minwuia thermotolerans]